MSLEDKKQTDRYIFLAPPCGTVAVLGVNNNQKRQRECVDYVQ